MHVFDKSERTKKDPSFKGWVCFHENGSYPYKIKVQLKLINLICNNYILGCPLSNYSHLKNPILISACIN